MATGDIIRAVVGIIKRDNTVLIAERPLGKPYSGYWEFPGGKIEENEPSLDALKRELHEELGIIIHQATHCFNHLHDYPDKTVSLEIWLVTDFEGEPHSKENQILQWATYEDMVRLKLLEGNYPILEEIKRLSS